MLKYLILKQDIAEPWQLSLQDTGGPIGDEIVSLHDSIHFYLAIIILFVSVILVSTIFQYSNKVISHQHLNHSTGMEIIWTILPALILIAIAFPSFKLLYLLDEVNTPALTIKTMGHQWYWSYSYDDYTDSNSEGISFDSYIVPTDSLQPGDLRLLEVDNKVFIPIDTHIRIIGSSTDVLHSFALPSFGIKLDCIPGRLNQAALFAKREGIYYGQCSEICGALHSAMPIVVSAVSLDSYINWVSAQLNSN